MKTRPASLRGAGPRQGRCHDASARRSPPSSALLLPGPRQSWLAYRIGADSIDPVGGIDGQRRTSTSGRDRGGGRGPGRPRDDFPPGPGWTRARCPRATRHAWRQLAGSLGRIPARDPELGDRLAGFSLRGVGPRFLHAARQRRRACPALRGGDIRPGRARHGRNPPVAVEWSRAAFPPRDEPGAHRRRQRRGRSRWLSFAENSGGRGRPARSGLPGSLPPLPERGRPAARCGSRRRDRSVRRPARRGAPRGRAPRNSGGRPLRPRHGTSAA